MTRDVRQATVDDVWAVHETARESWHAAYDEILAPERIDEIVDEWYAIGDLESSIADANDREDVAFLVAEPSDGSSSGQPSSIDGGVAVERESAECAGFVHAVPWPEDASAAYLARFYVSPDIWGEGTGTTLLERLEGELSASFDRLRLAVLAENDIGISFYESAGFDHVATRENDLGPGLEEYVYEKPL